MTLPFERTLKDNNCLGAKIIIWYKYCHIRKQICIRNYYIISQQLPALRLMYYYNYSTKGK